MTWDIALILAEDGILTGAIYALLALASVLVFATTRIIFVPQGEFVTFGALTLAAFQLGQTPNIIYLVGLLAAIVCVMDGVALVRARRVRRLPHMLAVNALLPALVIAAAIYFGPRKPAALIQILLTVALIVPLGPFVYRIAFQPVANASVRLLFVIAIAVHFVLQGAGLLFFGPEGFRVDPLIDGQLTFGTMTVSSQALLIVGTGIAFAILLYLLFEFTVLGKALRATAVNRLGARIVGISYPMVGKLCLALAALIGVISGILAGGLTTIYYDSGFIIGLKAFVGAILGNMISYPLAIVGALLVGLIESFGAFYSSAYKEAIVFALLIPALVWLSLRAVPDEEQEDL
ncbi:MAG: branched-chain amino acid ABC transporter permease [Rhizobiales bacterium]|nr:branched-chain amino acid ABC transporter permease [Hyphomicrobiales bacterium]OJY44201.1 MAG: branched-chain amino acid ABC transporter permease [Rhizobiales bacterium 64-17]